MSMAASKSEFVFRKPSPPHVPELTGITADGGIVALADGALLLAQGQSCRRSTDGGLTWGEAEPLHCNIQAASLVRLKSGRLAVCGRQGDGYFFSASADEGRSWSEPSLICPASAGHVMPHCMIQLSSGRLLFTLYWEGLDGWDYRDGTMMSVHPDLQYKDVLARGLWRGQTVEIEGHNHGPEMGISVVYRSDDEGTTWTKQLGGLLGWFDFEGVPNGTCGQTSCFEPTIAEGKDGNVLLIARSTVGRLVQSVSPDGGEHWYAVRPSDLASSASPAIMVTLPQTGDLLIVWNQMSREEARSGYRRGRLSAAISRDGGHSWENFRTLELSDGLEDVDRVPPEYPVRMVRARDWVGPLPDGWAYFHYPNADVVGDTVFVRYSRGSPQLGLAEQNFNAQEPVMRVYPVSWFYE